ncbi:hypothetical protein Hanom_Chr05g00391841 [Helianthus anomalus]
MEPDETERFQTFWIQMRENKPLDKSRKTGQSLGTKMAFYSTIKVNFLTVCPETTHKFAMRTTGLFGL